MTWLAWRQHRAEGAVIASVLVLLALLLFASHAAMAAAAQQLGVATCFAHPEGPNPDCGLPLSTFVTQFGWQPLAATALNGFPVLLGIFVGVPLVARELESGTQRLIWMQGVSRLRWLVVKLLLVLGMGLLATGVLTLLVSWWRTPFDQLAGSLGPSAFDLEGVVPLAYTTYALCLGVAAGIFVRRTIPAMLVTIGGFLALRLPVEFLLRPHYLAPLVVHWDPARPGAHSPHGRTDWVLADGQWVDASGHRLDLSAVFRTCDPHATVHGVLPGDAFSLCTHAHGWLIETIFQPADRFWLFQGIEATICVVTAAVILGAAIWWLQDQLS